MQQIFNGDKELMEMKDLRVVTVTKFDELSVKRLYNGLLELDGMTEYFSDRYP